MGHPRYRDRAGEQSFKDEAGDHPIDHVAGVCLGVRKLGKEKGEMITVQFGFEGYLEYKYRVPAVTESYCE